MANCKYCGRQLNGENFCPGCGSPVTQNQNINQPMMNQQYPNQQYPNQQYPNQQQMYQGGNQYGTRTGLPKDNNAIIGLVLGLVGFFITWLAAIPGLIFSINSHNDQKAGRVDPGNKAVGIIGLVLNIFNVVVSVLNILLVFLQLG